MQGALHNEMDKAATNPCCPPVSPRAEAAVMYGKCPGVELYG